MTFNEAKWFDILFDNTREVVQKIKGSKNEHYECLIVDGVIVAEMTITSNGTKYVYHE
ncbi:hypothetical protein [Serratia ureilytica]|jgi:hypothetical protein|uniref:hypothetical protein n=1 Tax=Serratia ureilytica TaxID=300181 RepID=UPI0019D238DB|nr:hypothetical protein [Serratia ureilytica]MBN5214281.1 hypothetical protein [Serratia ureilytica]